MKFELTDQQLSVAYGIENRLITCVKGEARCGKTTVIKFLKSRLRDRLAILTPTHAARNVLGKSAGASVIDGFLLNYRANKFSCIDYLIIDEASMLATMKNLEIVRVVQELNAERVKKGLQSIHLVHIGDPAQLPPVETKYKDLQGIAEGPFLKMKPDMWMIKRDDFPDRKIVKTSDLTDFSKDHFWLTSTNETRRILNFGLRTLICGYNSSKPRVGEKMICNFNDRGRGFYNSFIYEIAEVVAYRDTREDQSHCYVRFKGSRIFTDKKDIVKRYVKIPRYTLDAKFEREQASKEPEYRNPKYRDRYDWEFAYASTVHSAQGLEFDKIAIAVKSIDFNEDNIKMTKQLFYTAITRSTDVLIYDPDNLVSNEMMTDINCELMKAREEPDFATKLLPYDLTTVRNYFDIS